MLLQADDLDQALPGADRWHRAMVDMQSAWLRRQCERGPLGDDGQPTAAAGPRPSGEVTQAWVRGAGGLEEPDQFATTEALRWDDGERAAAAWVADVAAEAARCEGAVVVDPRGPSTGADVVVVARSWTGEGAELAPGDGPGARWSAAAVVAVDATALQVELTDAGASAEAAGGAVAALLQVTAARVQGADDATRLSGVADADLAGFTDDPDTAATPAFDTAPEPRVPHVTGTDLETAFPEVRRWEEIGRAGTGSDWLTSWCDRSGHLPVSGEEPSTSGGLFVPASTTGSGLARQLLVEVDVRRWRTAAGAADPLTAHAWAEAVSTDAADCPRARPAAAGAVPGSSVSAAVTADDDGGWRVQVATAGGPTAVRVHVDLAAGATEAEAGAAATSAVALARRVVANVVRADAAALERS